MQCYCKVFCSILGREKFHRKRDGGNKVGQSCVQLREADRNAASHNNFGRKLLWSGELVQARISHELEQVRHEIEPAAAAEFREILAGLPGYGSAITGRTFSVPEALPTAHCISKAVCSSSKKVLAKRATAL
jgi:hypothetical protein